MSVKGRRRPVVLYQPRDEGAWMPLGLLALGSQLAGEQVVIVDGRFELAPEASIVGLVAEAGCLGVSVRTARTLREALRVSAAARAANPRLTVLWGGPHASLAPASCLATGAVDACALGAGEQSFAAAVRAVRGHQSLAEIPGLQLSAGEAARAEPPPEPAQVACARYSLIDVERHFEARGSRRLDYCSSRGRREAAWRGFPAERVLAELADLRDRHQLSEVLFRDEDFFADPARADRIVGGLIEAPGRLGWRVSARVEDVVAGDAARVERLARAGCRGVVVSLAVDAVVAAEDREAVLVAARRLHAAQLAARFELRLSAPGPRLRTLGSAVSLARALAAIDPRFETPLQRTDDPARATATGETPRTLEEWAACSEAPWPDARAERRLQRVSFYLREAQRPPRRRPRQHLLRTLALLRVRLGFFGLDLERRLAEASTLVRTGRSRTVPAED